MIRKKFKKISHVNKFVCLIHKKSYAHKSSLNRHLKEKHLKKKDTKCKFCGLERVRIVDHEKRCQLKLLLN